MTTLQMLHKIEEEKVIYNIHYCRAGVGITFYDPPEDYKETGRDSYKKYLTVDRYYPTFEKAIKGEYQKLKGVG